MYCVRLTAVCGTAKATSWELLMFTWPLKRGCYQPRSRCVFSFTLGYGFARTHMLARTHKEALLNSHAPTPSPAQPSGRACLCQQMSGRRCVFLCLSLHSFHLLLQRLHICLRPRFISSHSNTPPPHTHTPTATPEDSSECVVFHSGIVYSENTILLFTADAFFPDTLKTKPARPAKGSLTKVISFFLFFFF